jgi:hypothetical protein
VVEHSLGKGEVDSSILSGSTIFLGKSHIDLTLATHRDKICREHDGNCWESVGGSSRDVRSLARYDSRDMGTKRWDHPSGTCRAVNKVLGPHMVVCHRCRRPSSACHRSTPPSSSCPFVCKLCGTRGEIRDVSDAPDDYAHESWTGRDFLAPKVRWRPTR